MLFIILFHELGHLFFASILGKDASITIYPFGGITKYNDYLNSRISSEFIILMGGPLFQEILYIILLLFYKKNLIMDANFEIINDINKNLLYFNFLPIIPLDGSKLLLLMLEKIFPYKKANAFNVIISFMSIFLFAIFEKRIIFIILVCLLIKSIIEEACKIDLKFNKFILERYLYDFKFKKTILVNDVIKFKRERYHKIKKDKMYDEKEYLNKIYLQLDSKHLHKYEKT